MVDDLPEKHVVFRSILDELGQNIVSARSGQEALRYILEMEFAVILLDVNMPDIDGLETASLIRQYKKSAQTPIVFITAYVDELQAKRGYALGAVDYIPSPVVPEVLRSKVRVFVELFRMNRQLQVQAAAARGAGPLRGGARGRGRCDPPRRLPGRSQPAAVALAEHRGHHRARCSTWPCPCWPSGRCWRWPTRRRRRRMEMPSRAAARTTRGVMPDSLRAALDQAMRRTSSSSSGARATRPPPSAR